ncbi:MAG: hypothetical protein RIB59_00235, partial [Rhodospirillales bacterium]
MGGRVPCSYPFSFPFAVSFLAAFGVTFGVSFVPAQAQEVLQIAPEVVVTATRVETPIVPVGSAITV